MNKRRYCLVIKRNNNDYLSLEWNLTRFYENENLYTLEEIDKFTRKMTRIELIQDVLSKNMVEASEKYQSFAIIYFENGKNREVKEGTIFKEDTFVFDEEKFILFILENLNNKRVLSLVYNMCNVKSDDKYLEEFKYVIKNIDLFRLNGEKGTLASLYLFKDIGYETKRKILLRLSLRTLKSF